MQSPKVLLVVTASAALALVQCCAAAPSAAAAAAAAPAASAAVAGVVPLGAGPAGAAAAAAALGMGMGAGPGAGAGPNSNCAALAGACVCIGDDVAQCVDTSASDLSFLRGLRNRSRFSEVIVYHNSMPTLRNGTFQALQLTNLKTLRLAYNGLATVEARALQGLRRLKKLVLVRNNLRSLHPLTFANASKLALLDLSNNQIAELNAVRHAPHLEDCRLADNGISELPAAAFCAPPGPCRLRQLNLASNEVARVDPAAFQGLHSLEALNLSQNKVPSLHPLTFSNASNLKELDLRRNRLSAVDFVCGIQSLKYLFLSDNRIAHVRNDTFVCGHQSALVHIDLSGNRIASLEPAAFHGLYSVWDLLLARNRLADIHPATFLNCTNLRSLDLRANRLASLRFVRDIIMLWSLDLSHNLIDALPPGTFAHHNLTQLLGSGANSNGTSIKFVLSRTITNINLSHNRLTQLERGALDGLYKLYQLDLSHNNISRLAPGVFTRHGQMARLLLHGNRLADLDVVLSAPGLHSCDASHNAIAALPAVFTQDTSRLRHLHLAGNNIRQLPPLAFANFSQLQLLNLTGNQLNSTAFVASAPVLEHVDLSWNSLAQLPQHAFNTPFTSSVKGVDVSHNRIASVHDGAFEGLYTLTFLNMSHNQIASIPPGAFRHTPALTELRLSFNRLTRVDWTATLGCVRLLALANNSLASLPASWLAGARSLVAVDVSGNALPALPDGAFRDLQHLQAVDASANNLQRVAPGAFRNASRLRVLRLAANRLAQLDFVADAAALEELDLAHNEIRSLPEPLVRGARPRLARLDLSSNRLTTLGGGALRNLQQLHALELRANALAHMHPLALAHCGALLQLGLGANRLARLADVAPAPRLKHLYVFHNRLPRLHNDSFAQGRLSQVVHLNVSGSGVAELEAGVFRPLRMLRYLDLSRNALRALPDALFAANTLLGALDLSANRLLALGPQLRPSACLEFVDASANLLRAVHDATFTDQVRYLDLSHNAIATVAPGAFSGLKKLEVLDLSHNNLSSLSGLQRLRDGSSLLLEGNPAAPAPATDPSSAHEASPQKRLFNLYDISTSELHKFAKLYMWILQSNNSAT